MYYFGKQSRTGNWISKIKLYFSLCFFLLLFYNCDTSKSSPIRPEDQHINFGYLKVNEEFKYTLVLQNPSKDTLFIDTLTTSCECVTLERKIRFISPVQKDSISFSFLSKEEGYITRGLAILFQNDQEPVIITIEGEVVKKETP